MSSASAAEAAAAGMNTDAAAVERMEMSDFPQQKLTIMSERKFESRNLTPMAKDVRGQAVGFLDLLAQHLDLPPGSLLQAVVLLDRYCEAAPQYKYQDVVKDVVKDLPDVVKDVVLHLCQDEVTDLPDVCVSICVILLKVERGECRLGLEGLRDLGAAADWFQRQLHDLGHHHQANASPLFYMETKVLQALDFDISTPGVGIWLTAYITRFDAATCGVVGTAGLVVFRSAASVYISAFEVEPKRLALGILCAGFVRAGLIPLEAFRPNSAPEWQELFGQAVPTCVQQLEGQRVILKHLQLATSSSLDEMQEDCLAFVRAEAHHTRSAETTGPASHPEASTAGHQVEPR